MGYAKYSNRKISFRRQRLQVGRIRRARRRNKFSLPDLRSSVGRSNAGLGRVLGTKNVKGGLHVKHRLPKL